MCYNPKAIDLSSLLDILFAVADPYTAEGQGNCQGEMYRAGVYYVSYEDEPQIELHMNFIATKGKPPAACGTLVLNDPNSNPAAVRHLRATAEKLPYFHPWREDRQNLLQKNGTDKAYIDFGRLQELGIIA